MHKSDLIIAHTVNINDYVTVGCTGHFNNDAVKYHFAYAAMTTLTETALPWDAEPVCKAIAPLREMAQDSDATVTCAFCRPRTTAWLPTNRNAPQ